MDFGTALGRELGLPQSKIDAVSDWRATGDLTETEKLVVELADVLTRTPAEVDDDLRRRLAAEFNQKQLVELAHLIAWENCRARFNRCFNVASSGYSDESSPRRPTIR